MSILKYLSLILVGLTATVCVAEIAIEAPLPQEQPENPSTPSGATPSEIELKVEPLRLAIDLVDGSHIIGVPSITSVTVQTAYAKMDISLDKIVSIEIKDDHETASFELENGDKLRGVLNLKPMELETIFGHVSVDVQHVRSIRVRCGVTAMTRAGLPASFRKDLVLYYSFDRNEGKKVTDKSGKKNDGKVNGAKWTHKGKVGAGFEFAGAGERVTVPQITNSGFPAKDFTIALWVAPDPDQKFNAGYGFIFGQGDAHKRESFGVLWRESGLFQVYSANVSMIDGAHVPSLSWSHAVLTYNAETMKLFINGKMVGQSRHPVAFQKSDLIIGTSEYSRQSAFHGAIDEVMIFGRALSDSEIGQIYDAQK